jgi:hypothetical protein
VHSGRRRLDQAKGKGCLAQNPAVYKGERRDIDREALMPLKPAITETRLWKKQQGVAKEGKRSSNSRVPFSTPQTVVIPE